MSEGTLHHQTWDQTSQSWSTRRSPPQPNLNVSISARAEDFRRHGHTLREETHNLATTAMADTGCQSCLAGPTLLASLQLTATDLIPVNLMMHSASGTNLPIMGAALLRIKIPSTALETRQMVYFSAIASKLYLSLATCLDLGLIPRDFPLSMSLPTGMAPTSSTTTQSVPIHWQEEVWIETYAGDLGTTDTWCHRMVICTKGLSVGPGTQLTCYKGDPPHPVPLPPGPSRSRKTIFDAWNGYHSVALAKEDRHFTTFITPLGRYRYCSAPQHLAMPTPPDTMP